MRAYKPMGTRSKEKEKKKKISKKLVGDTNEKKQYAKVLNLGVHLN